MGNTTHRGVQEEVRHASGYRADIEGLRAVAIGLVLLYHAGIHLVPGGYVGVDVFFVVSGFLITGLLIREIEATGRVSLREFWVRRAKRLLPASVLVLAVSAVATRVLLPVTTWRDYGGDIAAASLYVVNWRFALRSVDYLSEGILPSPVLHYWSLAVEEQFYMVWPLLLLGVAFVVRRSRLRLRIVLAGALLLIAVPSLAWSVYLTGTGSPAAFFTTTTRLWELAVGAGVALGAATWSRIPRGVAIALGWAGLSAVVVGALLFDDSTPWPGSAALVPTLGTAAVIMSGSRGVPLGASRVLALPPMVWVGGLSYSLYLWHWPFVVFGEAVMGELRPRDGVVLVLASLVPAWLSLRYLENPIRFSEGLGRSPRLVASLGANLTLVGVVAGLVLMLVVPRGLVQSEVDAVGARALGDDPAVATVEQIGTGTAFVPSFHDASADVDDVYADDCSQDSRDGGIIVCTYGQLDAGRVVVLVGDSHAAQWEPTIHEWALREGWRLETIIKSACPFADVDIWLADRPYTSCSEWVGGVIEYLEANPPGMVMTSMSGRTAVAREGARVDRPEADADLVAGLARTWTSVAALSPVVVLTDTPFVDVDIPRCLAENPTEPARCAVKRSEAVGRSAAPLQALALEVAQGVDSVDLTAYFCPQDVCPPVIGGVLVWRDTDHMTATYARTLGSAFDEQLQGLLVGSTG